MSSPHNVCPCCSEPLLRHARHGSVYWFCSHCWQEMPNLLAEFDKKREKRPLVLLGTRR